MPACGRAPEGGGVDAGVRSRAGGGGAGGNAVDDEAGGGGGLGGALEGGVVGFAVAGDEERLCFGGGVGVAQGGAVGGVGDFGDDVVGVAVGQGFDDAVGTDAREVAEGGGVVGFGGATGGADESDGGAGGAQGLGEAGGDGGFAVAGEGGGDEDAGHGGFIAGGVVRDCWGGRGGGIRGAGGSFDRLRMSGREGMGGGGPSP